MIRTPLTLHHRQGLPQTVLIDKLRPTALCRVQQSLESMDSQTMYSLSLLQPTVFNLEWETLHSLDQQTFGSQ